MRVWLRFCYSKSEIGVIISIGVILVQKKFPIIPVSIAIVLFGILAYVNNASHPVTPEELAAQQQAAAPQNSAKPQSTNLIPKITKLPMMDHKSAHLPISKDGMVVKDMSAPEKPKPNSTTVYSGWYNKDAMKEVPAVPNTGPQHVEAIPLHSGSK